MRPSPSIVPLGNDQEIYLVLDDFGALGSAWREANVEDTDLETVIADLLEGQFVSGPGGRFQPYGGMVAGRFGRRRARAAATLPRS
jgi:hypothetical protein